jgi:hypothetical protein
MADDVRGGESPLIEAVRRHIRSFEPGTLVGSELNVALHLRDLDGAIWEPWCAPGELADEESYQCPACNWHPGHKPEEWFREEAKLRGYREP